jgi:hypothetical protein
LGSFAAHRRSDVHAKSLELAAARAAQDGALPAPAEPHIQQFSILQNISLGREQQQGPLTHHTETQAEQDMWADWNLSDNVFEIGDSFSEIAHQKRQLFERKLDEFGIWEGEEELTGDILGTLEQAWDESAQDELLSEVLQGLGV